MRCESRLPIGKQWLLHAQTSPANFVSNADFRTVQGLHSLLNLGRIRNRKTVHNIVAIIFCRTQQLESQLPPDCFLSVQCDVAKEQDIRELFRTVDEKLGRVDVLINNAGITPNVANRTFEQISACRVRRQHNRRVLVHRRSDKINEKTRIRFTNSVLGHAIWPSTPKQVRSALNLPSKPFWRAHQG